MSKELTIKNNYDIAQPVQMVSMAKVLKQHIVSQNLYTNIVGKNYAHVEGWQFAGGLMGVYPRVASVENLSNGQEIKWRANVEIVRLKDDKVIGYGFAVCSNKENKKKSFDEYAILSMAQTRAIGKAYRNLIGWVMKMAGYEATPSEEMAKMGETVAQSAAAVQKSAPKEKTATQPTPAPAATGTNCAGDCGTIVENAAVIKFSKQRYGKVYCRDCQAKKRK